MWVRGDWVRQQSFESPFCKNKKKIATIKQSFILWAKLSKEYVRKHKWYRMMMIHVFSLQWIKSHPMRRWQSIWRAERSTKSWENKNARKAQTEKNRWNNSIYGTHHFRRQIGDGYVLFYYINYVWSFWQTLALLNRFKTKLSSAITEAPEEDVEDLEEDDDKGWWVSL